MIALEEQHSNFACSHRPHPHRGCEGLVLRHVNDDQGANHRNWRPVQSHLEARRSVSMTIQPFTIDISQADLDDLRTRLARTRWTDAVEGAGWSYGVDLTYLKELVNYWQHSYDWRKHESELNSFQQFKTAVDGVNIHFIHERGTGPNPTPIILTHGWP